jgi:hypothetical protein
VHASADFTLSSSVDLEADGKYLQTRWHPRKEQYNPDLASSPVEHAHNTLACYKNHTRRMPDRISGAETAESNPDLEEMGIDLREAWTQLKEISTMDEHFLSHILHRGERALC